MRLGTKITFLMSMLSVAMVVIIILVSLVSFRQFSLISAESHTRTAAEIIRVGLTESMINGTIDKRQSFLNRLKDVEGLSEARVVRGHDVVEQFGKAKEIEAVQDSIDHMVLETGIPQFKIIAEGMTPVFRSTIPFVADSRGQPNCLKCHNVPEGTVLGAVTITKSIPNLKEYALLTIGVMIAIVSIFAVIGILIFTRMIRPLVNTASEVQVAVNDALEGNFHHELLHQRSNDEIGQIAGDLKKLMKFLQEGLEKIRGNVAQLINCKPEHQGNLLNSTIGMVEGLIDAAHFKQAIEEDESREEVYRRLSLILQREFDIHKFSIYEVNSSKNKIDPVVVDGEFEQPCRWCDPNIQVRSDSCRARRTGHLIDGFDNPRICSSFALNTDEDTHRYICIPVIQSGHVGTVIQLVETTENVAKIHDQLTYINVYLREAAPVIEAKRLMDRLRESTLRDPMTGLHNRRFLDEYVETLVANTKRNDKTISILMLDLDFFKKVNDEYGHDSGDKVIVSLAKIFTKAVRASDLVIRYGGEEFIIILQDNTSGDGMQVAEKIRAMVEDEKFQVQGGELRKTISVGVAEFPTDTDTFWQAIKYADVALYSAKENGRNQVVRFTQEMWDNAEEY